MNKKASGFLKNFSYAFSANFITLLISTLVILVVPKVIGVEEYGYWQLYLFYATFVGFFQFGWNDGIYLRYGGVEYKNLDKELFFSQFWMLLISQLLLSGLIGVVTFFLIKDSDKQFIFAMVAICMVIIGVRAMLLFILQATNLIKEYAKISVLEKIFYCLLIFLFLFFGVNEYRLLIVADLLGKLFSLIYAIYLCKEIVVRSVNSFTLNFKEAVSNINIGIKLMFANIASILIIGIVRFGIERSWDVSTFGKVSLTLSISNLLMIFINAIGVIMFPILRRSDPKELPNIYMTMRTLLISLLLLLLLMYFPLSFMLLIWLPKYGESILYMSLLFPICLYEGKMSLLINTYLKTLRKEKLMLIINWISVVMSVVLTVIFTFIYKNLIISILCIVILVAFRCILAEIILSKILNIKVKKDIMLELLMTIFFIGIGWFLNPWIGVSIYLCFYILYLYVKRIDIISSIKGVKSLIKV